MASVDQVLGAQTAASGFFNPMIGGLGGAVSVGGGGAGGMPGPFDIEDGKIVRCALVFGRELLTCKDTAVPGLDKPAGVIYATVSHGSGGLSLSVAHDGNEDAPPDNGLDATNRLLYKAAGPAGAKYWADMRNMPVVAALD